MAFPATYADLLLSTREIKMTAVDDIINEAMNQRYILTEMLRGKTADQITKGGSALVDFIRVGSNGSFQTYRPGEQMTPASADTTKKVSQAWRYHQCNFGFLEEERILNENDPDAFFNMLTKDEGDAVIDFVNGMEKKMWAVPSNADMEDATNGREIFSLPVFVNEFTNGLPTGFSTVMTLNPSTYPVWKPQQQGYSMANLLNTTGASNSLVSALDACFEQVEFVPVPFGPAQKFQENDPMSKMQIITNLDGINSYRKIIRSLNDRTSSPQDVALGSPAFNGYAIKRISELDTAAIYNGPGALSASHSGGVAVAGAPRFYFFNWNYIYPIFNKDRFFEKKPLINGGMNLPNYWSQYYLTMANIWCRSRKRQGIVYPNAA